MDIKTITQVSCLINVSQARIEQSISRGQFLPSIFAESGKAREWSFSEVMRLALYFHLCDLVGIDAKTSGRLTQLSPHGYKSGRTYFVAYRRQTTGDFDGWYSETVEECNLTGFILAGCEFPRVLKAGRDEKTIKENSMRICEAAYLSVVLDLNQLEGSLTGGWDKV